MIVHRRTRRTQRWDTGKVIGAIMGTLFALLCAAALGYVFFEFLYYAINGEWAGKY